MTLLVPSTKEQIVCVAERLFAEHGLEGVSLRQIGAAAGNGNNSAVQYHFGTKEALVQAVFEYRLPRYQERVAMIVAERLPDDLRSWTECIVRTSLEQAEVADSWYLSFVAMLHHHQRQDIFADLPQDIQQSTLAQYDYLSAELSHIPEPLRTYRITQALVLILHAGADRERIARRGGAPLPFAVESAALVDGMVGFLDAPVSQAARDALDDSGLQTTFRPEFLDRLKGASK